MTISAGMIATLRPDLPLERSINNFTLSVPLTVYAEPSLKGRVAEPSLKAVEPSLKGRMTEPSLANIKFNSETLGVFPNWHNAATQESSKGIDYVMILEDDAIFCKSAYNHLLNVLDVLNVLDDFGYVSLYTSAAVTPDQVKHFYKGWHQYIANDLWGAVCLVFKRENLVKYLKWAQQFLPPARPSNIPPDKLVSQFFRNHKNYMHIPSLCEHLLPLSTSVSGKPYTFGCPPEQMRNRLAGVFNKDF